MTVSSVHLLNRYTDHIAGMVGRLKAESKQRKPFRLLEEEAFVNVERTADVLLQGVAETLKPAGLSPTQYNVLATS